MYVQLTKEQNCLQRCL